MNKPCQSSGTRTRKWPSISLCLFSVPAILRYGGRTGMKLLSENKCSLASLFGSSESTGPRYLSCVNTTPCMRNSRAIHLIRISGHSSETEKATQKPAIQQFSFEPQYKIYGNNVNSAGALSRRVPHLFKVMHSGRMPAGCPKFRQPFR